MLKKLYYLFNISIILILIPLLLISLYFCYEIYICENENVTLFGYKPYVVTSGSMYPTIEIGDIIIINKNKEIKENDIITFSKNDLTITHRIVDIVNDTYITKGDNNNSIDGEPVYPYEIQGKYILKIKYLGKIVTFLKTPFGLIISIIIILFIIYLEKIIGIVGRNKNEKQII